MHKFRIDQVEKAIESLTIKKTLTISAISYIPVICTQMVGFDPLACICVPTKASKSAKKSLWWRQWSGGRWNL